MNVSQLDSTFAIICAVKVLYKNGYINKETFDNICKNENIIRNKVNSRNAA